jgi:hypothetical protein
LSGDRQAAEQYFTPLRGMNAANDIKQRGFTGAIWPNQASDLAWSNVEMDAIENPHAAELYSDVMNSKREVRHDMLSFSSSRT